MPDKATERATAIVHALSKLMAAHEAMWRHGAPQHNVDTAGKEAIEVIANALRIAGLGVVELDPD